MKTKLDSPANRKIIPVIFSVWICFGSAFWIGLLIPESISHANPMAQPAIPNGIIETVYDQHHPFILQDRQRFRDVRRFLKDPPLDDRGDEFFYRATGYPDRKSFWFIGEGPFSDSAAFDPFDLKEEDFDAYLKILIDTCAYIGIEPERVDINRAKKEFFRIMDHLDQSRAFHRHDSEFPLRKAKLTAVTAILFDMVYMRIDTKDRHEPNRRFKAIRDQLASFCRAKPPSQYPPTEAAIYGSALGLSSLFCISVYPDEWKRSNEFSVHSLLPDLYLAVQWTQTGLSNLVTKDLQFQAPTREIDAALLSAIPWVQCMQRLGYPFVSRPGSFARLAAALEAHRIPGSVNMVQPYTSPRSSNPWLPFAIPLFSSDPMIETLMASATEETEIQAYADELALKEETEKNEALEQEKKKSLSPLSQAVDDFRSRNVNLKDEPRAITLREQLERFMQPQPQRPAATSSPTPTVRQDNWVMPNRNYLQTSWGTVYLLGAQETPQARFKQVWNDYAVEMDSHPYSFLYWKPFPRARMDESPETQFIRYPQNGFSLLAETTSYGDYLLASQASRATVMSGTYVVQSESFFLSENQTHWRWFHEIPVNSDRILSASEIQNVTESEPYLRLLQERLQDPIPAGDEPNASLQTSMYSYWSTASPSGKTLHLRRHLTGLGSAYTVTAHFPAPNAAHRVEYINFQMEEGSDTGTDPSVPGKLIIRPKEAIENTEPYDLEDWRRMQTAKRYGTDLFKPFGILNIVYSPEALKRSALSEGVVGRFLETELNNPLDPFFYITILEQPGREMFEVKYGTLPLPGLRFIEWRNGIEIISMNMGEGIDNTFIQSDADLVLVSRDQSYRGVFYLMVNGTRLQVRFSPKQQTWTTLANVQGDPVTVAWTQRNLYTTEVPETGSAFYAPNILGFQTPDGRIRYGKKNRQAVVLNDE